MICSNDHPRINFDGHDCPLCSERRERQTLDGWTVVKAMTQEARGLGAPSPVRLGVIIPATRGRSTGPADCGLLAQSVDGTVARPKCSGPWNKGSTVNAALPLFGRDITHALILDADIVLRPDALDRVCAWLQERPFVAVEPLDVDADRPREFDAAWFDRMVKVGRVRGANQVGGCVAYPIDWLRETGGMDEGYVGRGYHDLDLWKRAERDFGPGLLVPATEGLALHITHPVEKDDAQLERNRRRFERRWVSELPIPGAERPAAGVSGDRLWDDGMLEVLRVSQGASAPRAENFQWQPGEPVMFDRIEVTTRQAAFDPTKAVMVPPPTVPITCSSAGPGQSAFIDGLRALGFEAVNEATAQAALSMGRRVLYHGAWSNPAPGRVKPVVLWHSGFTGSDLMGEGAALANALDQARDGRIDLLWLDRRDVAPEGARHMVPVWDPASLVELAGEPQEKRPRSIAVALCGKYPSAAKNLLASVAGCCGLGAELHISESAFDGERGPVLRQLLRGENYTVHPFMERREVVRLLGRMELLVHPSTSDTWPYLTMEAVYAGTPVVGCETIAWMALLQEKARGLCVAAPATASKRIASRADFLLQEPEMRGWLLDRQRACLDRLASEHLKEARAILGDLGFPVNDEPVWSAPRGECAGTRDGGGRPGSGLVARGTVRGEGTPPSPGDRGSAAHRRDLSDEVTVFVISSGEPSLDACHGALDAQACTFQRQDIRDVTPMDCAFQAMLDRCETPYYVQVDADMLLEPWAIGTLYEEMKKREREMADVDGYAGCAQVVGWLWDDDFGRPLQGVKIYNHAICSRYPYVGELSCEMGQNEALKRDGYEVLGLQLGDQDCGNGQWRRTRRTLGTHFASQTPPMAFDRWQRLAQKHRALPWMGWLAPYFKRMEAEWLAEPDNGVFKARHLGAVAGLTGPIPDTERDASTPNQDYRRLARYVGEWSDGPRELTAYVTGRCNFRCTFGGVPCKRQAGGGVVQSGDMTPETLRAVLDTYPTIQSVCLAGFGEPLLHKNISGLLDVARERGLTAGLITNGSRLWAALPTLDRYSDVLSYVSVSLNAATEEEHRALTGSGDWDKVLHGIEDGLHRGLRVGISSVVTRRNVGGLRDLLSLAKRLGVAFVHLHGPLPHDGVTAEFERDHIDAYDDHLLDMLEVEARTFPGAELVEAWPQPIGLEDVPPGRCVSPFVSIGVDAAGNVTGCRRVDEPRPENGGFAWGWHSAYFSELIAATTGDRPEAHPECRGCFGRVRG